ncbi:TPA: hypothetical protein ACH3X1_008061 [Trebouxia sp. C0004]
MLQAVNLWRMHEYEFVYLLLAEALISLARALSALRQGRDRACPEPTVKTNIHSWLRSDKEHGFNVNLVSMCLEVSACRVSGLYQQSDCAARCIIARHFITLI